MGALVFYSPLLANGIKWTAGLHIRRSAEGGHWGPQRPLASSNG